MATEREVGLGEASLYCKLLSFGSTRWTPWGSRSDENETTMLVFKQ